MRLYLDRNSRPKRRRRRTPLGYEPPAHVGSNPFRTGTIGLRHRPATPGTTASSRGPFRAPDAGPRRYPHPLLASQSRTVGAPLPPCWRWRAFQARGPTDQAAPGHSIDHSNLHGRRIAPTRIGRAVTPHTIGRANEPHELAATGNNRAQEVSNPGHCAAQSGQPVRVRKTPGAMQVTNQTALGNSEHTRLLSGKAGDLGFEPRLSESESLVLPLHQSPMWNHRQFVRMLRAGEAEARGLPKARIGRPVEAAACALMSPCRRVGR